MSAPAPVSVVIPAHNAEKYLGEALESVLAQSVAPAEVIVVDDGSSDSTAQVAQSFPGVEYLRQENSGAAMARNEGVQRATSEYLAFLDADDLWTPHKLESQLAAFGGAAKCDMAFGLAEQFVSPELTPEERERVHIPHEKTPAIVPGALLMRRADFLRVGLLETSWEIGEFIDWYLRAVDLNFQSVVLPEVVLCRRIHTTNSGITKKDARGDYVRILKASLDRRRKQQSAANQD